MHPNKATNWKRSTAYRFLDFDDFISIDQFSDTAKRYRGMISDQANYEKIVKPTRTRSRAARSSSLM